MRQRVVLRIEQVHPRRIAAQDLDHLVDEFLALRPVSHDLHAFEHAVVFGVLVVGGILSALDARLRSVEKEQEVFRIRVVRIPSEEKQLRRAFANLVLKTVEVGIAHHQLQIDLLELLGQPVDARLAANAAHRRIKVDDQRLAARFVYAV